ncbi:MAG TPA: DUF2203 family protein [Gemmataceae bacterium]|nr:DUF2203 family protein [Gemmataceae bacterium]
MKSNRNEAKRRRQALQVWTQAQARAALPYLASVMQSVREHRLEANALECKAKKLAARPGRPDRDTIIRTEEIGKAARLAEERFQEALHELQTLDVYCIDPVGGLALIPFVHDKQLAWFIYDLFDAEPLQFWRMHSDPLETRRPVTELEGVAADEGTWLA